MNVALMWFWCPRMTATIMKAYNCTTVSWLMRSGYRSWFVILPDYKTQQWPLNSCVWGVIQKKFCVPLSWNKPRVCVGLTVYSIGIESSAFTVLVYKPNFKENWMFKSEVLDAGLLFWLQISHCLSQGYPASRPLNCRLDLPFLQRSREVRCGSYGEPFYEGGAPHLRLRINGHKNGNSFKSY